MYLEKSWKNRFFVLFFNMVGGHLNCLAGKAGDSLGTCDGSFSGVEKVLFVVNDSDKS